MTSSLHEQQKAALTLLDEWIKHRIDKTNYDWLANQLRKVTSTGTDKDLYITLGMIPRKFGKTDLELDDTQLASANQARRGWNPKFWSITGAARALVLGRLATERADFFGHQYQSLCRTADLSESLEFYAALPLLPNDNHVEQQVSEGLRTNMKAVFESIAHCNPYPMEFFDQNQWNHLVLKALFVDSTLAPIQGLDERANGELAGILCDYAHERWAAGRTVSCELWRCVGPFASDEQINDLLRVIESTNDADRFAAALALSQSPDSNAQQQLRKYPDLFNAVDAGKLQWDHRAAVPVMKN